jgi:hypothetical protein
MHHRDMPTSIRPHPAALPLAIAMALAGAGAQAQPADAVMPGVAIAALDTPITLDIADDIAATGEAEGAEIDRGIDTAIARAITATGSFTGLARTSSSGGKKRGAADVTGTHHPTLAEAGVNWAALGARDFGSPDALAVAVEEKFADSNNLATQVRLRHASGPVDVRFNVKGNKVLASDDPMRLSYDSSALYQLSPALAVGVLAKGDLGTFREFAPNAQHDAGAIARLKLLGNGTVLSAETGYALRLGPGVESNPANFHMNLNFNWKL